jgi:hypothetical protein
MSRDHASVEERFRCLHAEHVDPILGAWMSTIWLRSLSRPSSPCARTSHPAHYEPD